MTDNNAKNGNSKNLNSKKNAVHNHTSTKNNLQKQSLKNPRQIVLEILILVLEEGKLSHLVIRDKLKEYDYLEKQDKSFINRIADGTIERKITIDYIINQFSKVRVNKMKPLIREVLRMAVYQIIYMDSIPDSAACNEAVKTAKKYGFSSLSGFVNGILRNISRQKDSIKYPNIEKSQVEFYSVKYSIPEWLVQSFINDYGQKITEEMLENMYSKTENTITVKVNSSKADINEVIESVLADRIEVKKSNLADNALIIKGFERIDSIKAFRKGLIQVQDISSMLAGQISGIKKDDICIDMCAAPGGKSIHAADILNGTGYVYSRDLSETKVNLIRENIDRCGFENISEEVWDATEFKECDKGKADVVIADVPCSGMGVIRKKTDIKYNISEESVKDLAKLSQKILNNAVKYLKTGGILIFSTCTMNKIENDENRKWLIEEMHMEPTDFTDSLSNDILNIGLNRETAKKGYLQLFMTKEFDGFYISKFIKK